MDTVGSVSLGVQVRTEVFAEVDMVGLVSPGVQVRMVVFVEVDKEVFVDSTRTDVGNLDVPDGLEQEDGFEDEVPCFGAAFDLADAVHFAVDWDGPAAPSFVE